MIAQLKIIVNSLRQSGRATAFVPVFSQTLPSALFISIAAAAAVHLGVTQPAIVQLDRDSRSVSVVQVNANQSFHRLYIAHTLKFNTKKKNHSFFKK